jgi:hypothetical protein
MGIALRDDGTWRKGKGREAITEANKGNERSRKAGFDLRRVHWKGNLTFLKLL